MTLRRFKLIPLEIRINNNPIIWNHGTTRLVSLPSTRVAATFPDCWQTHFQLLDAIPSNLKPQSLFEEHTNSFLLPKKALKAVNVTWRNPLPLKAYSSPILGFCGRSEHQPCRGGRTYGAGSMHSLCLQQLLFQGLVQECCVVS